jgi:4-hydroxy-tetrahydrodipicolinate synthase
MKLHGIIPPIVTPMKADESLDLEGLRRHIDWMLNGNSETPLKVPLVHGIFVLGTTGEFYSLTEDEKQAVVATTVSHVNGRMKVYAGTGAETTREVVRLTKMAEKEGVEGVSVLTPYFLKPTQAELVDYFTSVSDATSKQVILYSNPQVCAGVMLEPETVAKLAERKNIVAVKDSAGDFEKLLDTLAIVPKTFSVLMGRDTLMLNALIAGASGAIPATCNIAPELCVGIYESFKKGDLAAAKQFQDRLSIVRHGLSLGTGNGVVKEAMALRGRSAGPSRRPISPLSDEKRMKLKGLLIKAGLLNSAG